LYIRPSLFLYDEYFELIEPVAQQKTSSLAIIV